MKHRRNRQRGFKNKTDSQRTKNSVIYSLISALGTFLIRDLTNENSKVKAIVSKIFSPKIEKNKIIEPEYEVIDKQKEKIDGKNSKTTS